MATRSVRWGGAIVIGISLWIVPLRGQALIQAPPHAIGAMGRCTIDGCDLRTTHLSIHADSLQRRLLDRAPASPFDPAARRTSSGRAWWKIAIGALIGTAAGFYVADRVCRQQCIDGGSRSRLYAGYGGVGAIVGGFTAYLIAPPRE